MGFRVPVSTTAALVCSSAKGYSAAWVRNAGSGGVFLGGKDVTADTGYELPANTVIGPLSLRMKSELWAIRQSGTGILHVLGEPWGTPT